MQETQRVLIEFPISMIESIKARLRENPRSFKGKTLNAFVRFACGRELGEKFEGEKFPVLSSGGRRPGAGRKPKSELLKKSAKQEMTNQVPQKKTSRQIG